MALDQAVIETDGLQELLEVYDQHQASVVAVRRVAEALVSKYGIVDGQPIAGGPGDLYSLDQLVEKPAVEDAPTNLAIAGRYLFNPEVFDCLERTGKGKGGEVQLTDAMNMLASESQVQALAWRAKRYDIGDKADYVRCFLDFAARHPETQAALEDYLREQC